MEKVLRVVRPDMKVLSLPCRVLAEAAGVGGAAVRGSDRDPAQLDVLPLLRHGRAVGLRHRVASVLGLRQPGVQIYVAGALRRSGNFILLLWQLCNLVCSALAASSAFCMESMPVPIQPIHSSKQPLRHLSAARQNLACAVQITTVDEAKQFYPLFGLGANVALIFCGRAVVTFSQVPLAPHGVLLLLLLFLVYAGS